MGEVVRRDEAQSALEARRELGPEYEDQIVDALVEKIEQRLDRRDSQLKLRRDHQKGLILGSLGISVPLFAIAAVFAGLAGIVAVAAALAVIALAATRAT